MAFCCLIYPFQWQYILIPLLPGIYKELLDAPVPYIAGMNTRSDEKSLILQKLRVRFSCASRFWGGVPAK